MSWLMISKSLANKQLLIADTGLLLALAEDKPFLARYDDIVDSRSP